MRSRQISGSTKDSLPGQKPIQTRKKLFMLFLEPLGVIFAHIFRGLLRFSGILWRFQSIVHISTDFVQILRNFVRTFTKLHPVIAWHESMTRVDSSHDFWWFGLNSSHVEKNGDSTRVTFFTEWLDSSHNQWPETLFRVIFTKSLSLGCTNWIRLHTKKWAFFASVMIKIGANFPSWLSSRAMLHCKDQVSPTCAEVYMRCCFLWRVSRAQYIDTLSWFNVVFAYRDHGSGPHPVTLSFFQIPVKRFKFFRYRSNPKIKLQNIMEPGKPNLV